MPETTPLIKAALNLRGGAGFDVYLTPHHYTDKKKSAPNWRNIMHEKRAIRFHGIALLNKTILYLILFFFT